MNSTEDNTAALSAGAGAAAPGAPAGLSEEQVQAFIDNKTKPHGALGRLESIAAQIALLQQRLDPVADRCRLVLFAADHGIANAGVSAYPQAVTRQMVENMLAGGAAANVFAQTLDIAVTLVDAGICGAPIAHPALIDRRIGAGTANALVEPAMTPAQLQQALAAGHSFGTDSDSDSDSDVVCFGEMGIGNTASASLVAAAVLSEPVAALVGRGTGLDDAGLARKHALLERALQRAPGPLPADEALRQFGGFEIAMMAGAMLGAAEARRLIIVDGFIATVASLAALRLAPEIRPALLFAHRSAEAGHQTVLDALAARPLLDLSMHLGEGSGALLAWPLVRSAVAMLRDMASFDSAGVSGPA